jgi:protein-tyrosine phosphatase
MKKILFLCTGNYYRSRYAEFFFNHQAVLRDLPWRAESRGLRLSGLNPGPISRHTVARMRAVGITGDEDRMPCAVRQEDFAAADHVVAVKRTEHEPLVEARFLDWLARVEFWEVHDIDCATPEVAMPHLEREILELIDRLAASTDGGEEIAGN